MTVFVDTVAWIALMNRRDNLHVSTTNCMNKLRQQNITLITTEFVLLEVADALCDPKFRALTVDYIDRLRRLKSLTIIPASQSLWSDAWALYRTRPDKGWSLTDCTSFIVMTAQQVTQAFTSDRHFEQAGFTKLL
jgi:predicted nucleic acid-binding protein